jgi:hypothetical protein
MLLEETFKTKALRSNYSVSVQNIRPEKVPQEIRKYYSVPWTVECRILYESGKRLRTQWVFQDAAKVSLFIAVIGNDGSGFIEWFNDKGFVQEEQRLDADGSGYFISYTYRDQYLLKAEATLVEAVKKPDGDKVKNDKDKTKEEEQKKQTPETEKTVSQTDTKDASPQNEAAETSDTEAVSEQKAAQNANAAEQKPPPPQPKASERARKTEGPAAFPAFFVAVTGKEGEKLWTDNYRYTRSLGLRAIERVYHNPKAEQKFARTTFPRVVPDDSPRKKDFVSPAIPFSSDFLRDIYKDGAVKINYNTDSRRRIVNEMRFDGEDKLLGEFNNIWEGDRLSKVTWKGDGEERVIEFRYNRSGERISERDYRNGVLERSVTINKDEEIEELYLSGETALRAIWKDGKKISEERLLNRTK